MIVSVAYLPKMANPVVVPSGHTFAVTAVSECVPLAPACLPVPPVHVYVPVLGQPGPAQPEEDIFQVRNTLSPLASL